MLQNGGYNPPPIIEKMELFSMIIADLQTLKQPEQIKPWSLFRPLDYGCPILHRRSSGGIL